ncbi:putative Gamma-tubulin complex component 2 [Paratrimastix pyriformis]|uniref:Gamma-tubulin complex component 2 n=1 Tax=Paratrimastix pyriformis TaxID=342808 RepID=A0ABQ8UE88_9EUKA|nr:putative Gamma-tubulin complex component 2 [Paratrimastix pyriformis]
MPPQSLQEFPLTYQEVVLIEDLLTSLAGLEGKYIKIDGENARFVLQAAVDISLAEITHRILPLCSAFLYLSRFSTLRLSPEPPTSPSVKVSPTNFRTYGTVCHALSGALRTTLKDHLVLVTQLEESWRQGQLTLQKLLWYVQPHIQLLVSLEKLMRTVGDGNLRGGELLSVLHSQATSAGGSALFQQVYGHLVECACEPYLRMLSEWIYRGVICDPYQEFMVEEVRAFSKDKLGTDYNDGYWEQRYRAQRERAPSFLVPFLEKVLVTGKYLNVIRECGRDITCTDQIPLRYVYQQASDHSFGGPIESAYRFATRSLLETIMERDGLISHLKTIRSFFFLAEGDFFVHFMDLAESELAKEAGSVVVSRLASVLEQSLRSCASIDSHREDVGVEMLPESLLDHLRRVEELSQRSALGAGPLPSSTRSPVIPATGLQPRTGLHTVALTYSVRFPLSLVLNRKSLAKYQLINRLLFMGKMVERALGKSWRLFGRNSLWPTDPSERRAAMCYVGLRHRMQHLVQNVLYFQTCEIIDPRWHEMEQSLRQATTSDEVLNRHADFLDTCLEQLLLTDMMIMPLLVRLFMHCLALAALSDKIIPLSGPALTPSGEPGHSRLGLQRSSAFGPQEGAMFIRSIAQLDEDFSKGMSTFMQALAERAQQVRAGHVSSLLTRLAFNGFYSTPNPSTPQGPSRPSAPETLSRRLGLGPSPVAGPTASSSPLLSPHPSSDVPTPSTTSSTRPPSMSPPLSARMVSSLSPRSPSLASQLVSEDSVSITAEGRRE